MHENRKFPVNFNQKLLFVKFRWSLLNGFQDIWKRGFYDVPSIRLFLWTNVADNWNSPIVYDGSLPNLISAIYVEPMYGIHERVRLWPYVNQILLWVSMAKNRNFLTFSESLPINSEEYMSNGVYADTASQTWRSLFTL